MIEENTTRLFVYGTLMPGLGNSARIEQFVRSAQPASVEGVLIDLGAFPALIPGHGLVKGVLLELEEEALAITDLVEGYDPDTNSNLYIRKTAKIRLADGEGVTAWVYEFAKPEQIADHPHAMIESSGDKPVYEWTDRKSVV